MKGSCDCDVTGEACYRETEWISFSDIYKYIHNYTGEHCYNTGQLRLNRTTCPIWKDLNILLLVFNSENRYDDVLYHGVKLPTRKLII